MSTEKDSQGGFDTFTAIRRASVALGMVGLVASILRLTGHKKNTKQLSGGWHELNEEDFEKLEDELE